MLQHWYFNSKQPCESLTRRVSDIALGMST